ncbi:hypothetical protein EVJ32_04795 [Exiguobacterium sp. SH5S4]|uniref:hypothetical protein n=1 Tax=Exiguobacterium sp. SH5S4 TaxID=2510961 RepID=UPI00103A1145|nr:hypothetical protein [Exiguobacterium sp. SH5S4]TCI26695.1 hypothetical protein EVJ32_04795 [Exiguobacterium sp. SH5S4]
MVSNVEIKHTDGAKYHFGIGQSAVGLMIMWIKITPKGKRKSLDVGDQITNDWRYRQLDSAERATYLNEKVLEIVPKDVIEEALLKTWEEMKPNEIKFSGGF